MALKNRIHLPAALLIVAIMTCLACRQEKQPETTAPTPPPPPAFDAEAAFSELENIVSFGSRAHGTIGHDHVSGYLKARLRALGVDTRIQSFTNDTARGRKTFHNLEAVLPGTAEGIMIVSTHYDSMQTAEPDFQAANAAGSGPAVLLEMLRVAKESYQGAPELRFVFFDGQEPLVRHSSGDGLRGSSYYADQLIINKTADRVDAVINLNLVGDKDLSITIPRNVSKDLRRELLRASREENARTSFKLFDLEIGDDHDPFYQLGIPAINIIDFEYGSEPGRNDYWRTPRDTLDHISAESLGIIGRVTLRLVQNLAEISETQPYN